MTGDPFTLIDYAARLAALRSLRTARVLEAADAVIEEGRRDIAWMRARGGKGEAQQIVSAAKRAGATLAASVDGDLEAHVDRLMAEKMATRRRRVIARRRTA